MIRVYKRYFGINKELKKITLNEPFIDAAHSILPNINTREYNFALLDFAALVCKFYNPRCYDCPISFNCNEYNKPNLDEPGL